MSLQLLKTFSFYFKPKNTKTSFIWFLFIENSSLSSLLIRTMLKEMTIDAVKLNTV